MKLTIGLNSPGMTGLHKAGLAGLYMTLHALEETGERIPGLTWDLEPSKVVLTWTDSKVPAAFALLVDKSFWLDDGFIRLTGLELSRPPDTEQKFHLYTALLNSFLQFGPHRPTDTKRSLTYEVDEKRRWIPDFAPVKSFRHQQAVSDFVGEDGRFRDEIVSASWLYPGGGQRHVAHARTKIKEPLDLAFALLFAPVGVVYFSIRSRTKGRKARLAMVVPEVTDLATYAEIREAFAEKGVFELTASSTSDAALRFLTLQDVQRHRDELSAYLGARFSCRVITFGIVSWNEKQKSRTYTRTIAAAQLPGLENYRKAAAIFKNRWQRIQSKVDRRGNEIEPERFFATTFCAREMIAENIASGRAWYDDLSTYLSRNDFREQIAFERKELNEMVEIANFDDENERIFIRVCHESWRRRLGKLGKRALAENTSFQSLARKDAEKLRSSLCRCKNATTLRETVVDFWSRAGANEALRGEGLGKLLPLFNEQNWKKARDLALLALISYEPQTEEEAAALTVSPEEQGDEDE